MRLFAFSAVLSATAHLDRKTNSSHQSRLLDPYVLLVESDEGAFSMAELFAPSDDIRRVGNVDLWLKRLT